MKNKKKKVVCFLIVLILIILSSYVFADGWCAPSGCGDCKTYEARLGYCCQPSGKKCAEGINAIVNCIYDTYNDYGCLYEDVNTGYIDITYCGDKESCVQYSDCKTFACMDDCYKYSGFCAMSPSGSYTEIRNIYPEATEANGFCIYMNRWSYGLCIKCNAGYHQDGYACVIDKRANGETCSSSTECLSGSCIQGICCGSTDCVSPYLSGASKCISSGSLHPYGAYYAMDTGVLCYNGQWKFCQSGGWNFNNLGNLNVAICESIAGYKCEYDGNYRWRKDGTAYPLLTDESAAYQGCSDDIDDDCDNSKDCADNNCWGTSSCPTINGKCGIFLNSCDAGTFKDVADTATDYKWNCEGSAGGTTESCSLPIPVNGKCGPAAKTYLYTQSSFVGSLCDVGPTINPSNPSFPAQGSSTGWQCQGSNGGSNADCSASRNAAPVDGQCGASLNTCNAGNPQDDADTSTHYKWTCLGLYGGSNIACSSPKCNPSYANSCDSTDGCGGTRSTSPYNSCDLSSNVACETEAGKCSGGIDNDCDGYTDGEDASCIYVNSITAPGTASQNTAFTITCGISSTTKLANCIGVKVDGVAIPDSNFMGWSGTSPQFTYTSSTTGQKTLECYISNKADSSCTIGSDTGNPAPSSKTATITITSSLCSGRTQTECTGLCKWCSSCSSTQSFTGTSQCIDSASTCGYSCKKNSCNALCDANDGTNCDLSTCSCKTSGACDTSTKICSGYWCSSGQVCQERYKWNGVECKRATTCSPTCSTPFDKTCAYPYNAYCGSGTACCSVNLGVQTTDCVAIEVIPSQS